MGPSTERQHSASKDSSKRIHRGDQGQRRHLCVNTDLLCLHNATGPSPSTLQQLDLSDRRHFNSLSTCRSSNSRSLYVSTSRVLQRLWPDRLAAQQSHIWTTQQSKGLAKSPSKGDATIGTTTPCEWAQRLRNTWRRRLHPMLRGRPPFHWSTGDGQQAVPEHSATPFTTSNRRAHSRQHHQLFGQKHLQQRWLLRDQPSRSLHNRGVGRSQHAQLQPSTSTRQQHSESNFQRWNKNSTKKNMQPTEGWLADYDGWHVQGQTLALQQRNSQEHWHSQQQQTNRNWHTYSGTSRELNTTSSTWDQQSKHKQLKQHQTFRSLSTVTGPDAPQQESRQQAFWSKSLEQQSTTAAEHSQHNCAEQRGSRTIRDQHRSNRSPTHQQSPERSSQHEEDQHPHPHRLVKQKEHGNKNWIIKEGQTHRAQTPVYTTAGRTWPCEDCQDQHRQQPGRHLHQVRCNRDASALHQWCWDQHPSSLSFQTTTSNSFTAASALMCERVHIVRTSCVACTHRHTSFEPWCQQRLTTWTTS